MFGKVPNRGFGLVAFRTRLGTRDRITRVDRTACLNQARLAAGKVFACKFSIVSLEIFELAFAFLELAFDLNNRSLGFSKANAVA